MLKLTVASALTVAAALVAPAADAAAPAVPEREFTVRAAPAPGPARLDEVFVREYGPRDAGTILVLTPGSPGGQANYAALAPELVRRVDDLAIWALDRRANILEDRSGFAGTPDEALGYYYAGQPLGGRTFAPVTAADAPYVFRWGAKVAIEDLHRVVRAARDGGRRKVVLGGHSEGAVTVPTYAVWDFDGRGGYEDLAGLLQIDGGQFGTFERYARGSSYAGRWRTAAQARAGLAEIAEGSPFGITGPALPAPLWTIGVLPELSCAYALDAPDAASPIDEALPAALRPLLGLPEETVTNEAFFGLLVTSGEFAAFDMRAGRLAAGGTPRGWIDGTDTTVARVCRTFTQEPHNGLEWYYPTRLGHDLMQALPELVPTPATRALGLRPLHLHEVDTPLFAFETSLSHGGVFRGAKRFIARSKVTSHRLVKDHAMGHFDPLMDVPAHNRFIKTVVPWLNRIAG